MLGNWQVYCASSANSASWGIGGLEAWVLILKSEEFGEEQIEI